MKKLNQIRKIIAKAQKDKYRQSSDCLYFWQMMFKGDWGCFPNKQICEDCTEGKIEKMSEPVQVYTACQFARSQNSAS